MRTPPEYNRVKTGQFRSTAEDGVNGAWMISSPMIKGRTLAVIANDSRDWEELHLPPPAWEHVSVHAIQGNGGTATPTWSEMSFIKDLFWAEEECVIQYHPPHSSYVNYHQHTLHLWRPVGLALPMPPLETL